MAAHIFHFKPIQCCKCGTTLKAAELREFGEGPGSDTVIIVCFNCQTLNVTDRQFNPTRQITQQDLDRMQQEDPAFFDAVMLVITEAAARRLGRPNTLRFQKDFNAN